MKKSLVFKFEEEENNQVLCINLTERDISNQDQHQLFKSLLTQTQEKSLQIQMQLPESRSTKQLQPQQISFSEKQYNLQFENNRDLKNIGQVQNVIKNDFNLIIDNQTKLQDTPFNISQNYISEQEINYSVLSLRDIDDNQYLTNNDKESSTSLESINYEKKIEKSQKNDQFYCNNQEQKKEDFDNYVDQFESQKSFDQEQFQQQFNLKNNQKSQQKNLKINLEDNDQINQQSYAKQTNFYQNNDDLNSFNNISSNKQSFYYESTPYEQMQQLYIQSFNQKDQQEFQFQKNKQIFQPKFFKPSIQVPMTCRLNQEGTNKDLSRNTSNLQLNKQNSLSRFQTNREVKKNPFEEIQQKLFQANKINLFNNRKITLKTQRK